MMKKTLTLAVVATVFLTGSVFAQFGRHVVAEPDATFAFGVGGAAAGPNTTNNDDTCDVAVAPAATLLLPYFEVETVPPAGSTRGTTTFFTITNTSRVPQIAHITLWTDWSFPVLDFNVFLTGYDVAPMDLYDIIVNGQILPPPAGLSGTGGSSSTQSRGVIFTSGTATTTFTNLPNTANPNFNPVDIQCSGLPGTINSVIAAAVKSALVSGIYSIPGTTVGCGTTSVGSSVGHPIGGTKTTSDTSAIGYVTVDVSSICSTTLPTDSRYFANEILFDNTLIGDYQIFSKVTGDNYAGGNPMVHIRAVPEGGPAGAVLAGNQTNFPYTFYSRYINGVTIGATTYTGTLLNLDRRQPLPSVFAARWIQGGTSNLASNFRVWREGVTGANIPAGVGAGVGTATSCAGVAANSALAITELVRFDEHENAEISIATRDVSPSVPITVSLPETGSPSSAASNPQLPAGAPAGPFPPAVFTSGDVGGWMYLNLNSGTTVGGANIVAHPGILRASQNWVVVSMRGTASASAGSASVDYDAAWLGNGCSGAIAVSSISSATSTTVLGPVGGTPVCPLGATCTPLASYPGTNTTP